MRRRKGSRGMESQIESELPTKPQDQRQQQDGQVRRRSSKTNVAAPRIRHYQDLKKGVCAHLTWTPIGWMVSPFSSCAVQSITHNAAKYSSFSELLLQTSHHSESPKAFVILSYQFSDLSRLNVIFICSSLSELIKVSFGYIINEVIWMHLFDRTTLFYFFTVWLKDEVRIV